jgi:tetratricopeptide (TPR) repeat protein
MAKFALLIGVSEYSETSFAALPAATKDVEAMKQVLENPEIGDFNEIKTLINPSQPEMSEAIETYFSDRQSEDLILFFFSGHGVKDEKRDLFFSARNTRKNREKLTKSTAVAASFVRDSIKSSKAKRQIVILDCCFSGAFGDLLGKDDDSLDIENQLSAEGIVVLTSSSSTQYSFEQKNADLSLYTRYLVEGMKTGAADKNGDGFTSVDELHDYVSRKVQEAAPALVNPRIIVLKDEGFKIQLAKAPIGDPMLKYRQEVEQQAKDGKFSIPARGILDLLREELKLSSEQALVIEDEVLQPYREYQRKLQKYEEIIERALKAEYPLSQDSLNDLKDYQKRLGLRDRDIKPIEARVKLKLWLIKLKKPILILILILLLLTPFSAVVSYSHDIFFPSNISQNKQLTPIPSKDAEAYIVRGNAKYNLGDKQGAIADYNQAIKLQPDDATAYYNRGVVKYNSGDKQGAIADYNQAIKLQPDYADAYYNRGLAKKNLGDKQGAIADYNQAIKLQPDYAAAYNGRGNAKYNLGDKQGAIADYKEAAKLYQQQNKTNYYQDALNGVKALEQ